MVKKDLPISDSRKVIQITHIRVYPEDGRLYEALKGVKRPASYLKTLATEALVLRANERRSCSAPQPPDRGEPAAADINRGLARRLLSSLPEDKD